MNVLFLSTRSPYPLISGHSMRTYHTLLGCSRRHQVILLTFVQLREELEEKNLAHLRGFCRCVIPMEVPVDRSRLRLGASVFRNLFSPLPFVAEKYDATEMRCRIREVLDRERIDLAHVDLLPLSVYADEFDGLPRIIVNHNVESLRLRRWYEAERSILRKAFLWLQTRKLAHFERAALDRFDSCIVVSRTDRDILARMGVRARMFIVPNGTDTKYFRPTGREPEPDTVLWIGHMDVHTNRDAVLFLWREVFPILREHHPAIRLHVVGTAPPREIVRAAEKDGRIRAPGFVPDIRPYLERASAVLVPIRIGSGTRVKILDAMAMGKAIVSTSVGCEGLEVRDGKDILIADDPESFAERTVSILRDRGKRRTLERNARELALEYDWDRVVEKQEEAYAYALAMKAGAKAVPGRGPR